MEENVIVIHRIDIIKYRIFSGSPPLLAITTSKKGLDIAHLGFAVWRKDGLHLLNASQLHHKGLMANGEDS